MASRRRLANTCTLNDSRGRIPVDGGRKLPESRTADRPDLVTPLFYGESWEKRVQLSEKGEREIFLKCSYRRVESTIISRIISINNI